jgi:hypothetical protein
MKTPTYKDQTVGCAASAIVFSLAKTGFYGTNLKNHISGAKGQKNWVEKAKELQIELKWKNTVLVSQIGDFVQMFPQYRIIVVDLALKSSQASDWKGSDYFPNGAKSIIFLHYNTIDMHFSAISSIKEFVCRKGKDYNWCYDCSSYFTSASQFQNCYCHLPNQVPKKRKQMSCEHCGFDYRQGTRHICYHSQCRSCMLTFNNSTGGMLAHRCPIFMNVKSMPSKFLNEPSFLFEEDKDEELNLKPPFALWVYDLESCIVPVEGIIDSFAIDKNGYFAMDGRLA